MPTVAFTPNLKRHLCCPVRTVPGATVREVLENIFTEEPKLRGYVLDDQGRLRQHLAVFVDGSLVADRQTLNDRVNPHGEIFVMQALSGG
jgi:sulfur carrier protein ThiS